MRVLVVDDDQSAAHGLSALLKLDGHDVTARTSGAEAVATLARERFDAVITDLEMPESDGHVVVREARRRLPMACVIVCGARASKERITLLEDGACFVVDKPVDYDGVMNSLFECRRNCCRKQVRRSA